MSKSMVVLPQQFYFVNVAMPFGSDKVGTISQLMYGSKTICAVYEDIDARTIGIESEHFKLTFGLGYFKKNILNAENLGVLITETLGYHLHLFD